MYYIGNTEIKPYVKINRKDQENFGSSYFNLIEIGTSICSPIFYIPRQRTINRGANGSSKLSLIFHAYTINRSWYRCIDWHEDNEMHHQPCSLTYTFFWQTFFCFNRSMNYAQCSLGTEFLLWILTKTYTGAEYVNIFIFTDENFLPVMIRITICKTRKKRAARGKMRTNLETVLGAKHSSQHCLRTCMLAAPDSQFWKAAKKIIIYISFLNLRIRSLIYRYSI